MVEVGRRNTACVRHGRTWTGSRFPLFRISESGAAVSAGELITLAAHQTAWMPMATVVGGLPAELADARPSGFLGRHFAAVHADLRLPPRLSDWSDHHILLAMSRRGEDLPGNLIVGEESFARWQGTEACFQKPRRLPGSCRGNHRRSSAGLLGRRRAAEIRSAG